MALPGLAAPPSPAQAAAPVERVVMQALGAAVRAAQESEASLVETAAHRRAPAVWLVTRRPGQAA